MKRTSTILLTFIFLACVICITPHERGSAQRKAGQMKPTPIEDKYQADKGSSVLGTPLGGEQVGAGGGRFRLYQQGAIYWSSATGAHEIHGNSFQKYKEMGAESGALGYPVTDVVEIAEGGSEVVFQHGSVMVSKTGDAQASVLPWATFKQDGVSLKRGVKAMKKSASTASLLPQSGTGGDTTVTCSCNTPQRLGSCDIHVRRGNTVQCAKGSCFGSCIIIVKGSQQ
jgi:hypothetical protein